MWLCKISFVYYSDYNLQSQHFSLFDPPSVGGGARGVGWAFTRETHVGESTCAALGLFLGLGLLQSLGLLASTENGNVDPGPRVMTFMPLTFLCRGGLS